MENMTTSLNDEVLVLEVSSEDEARAQAAAVWPHLSPAQQTSLRSTLRLHGMAL